MSGWIKRKLLGWLFGDDPPPPIGCDCPACQSHENAFNAISFPEGEVIHPTDELLREVVIWNDIIRTTPAVRMQRAPRWTQ